MNDKVSNKKNFPISSHGHQCVGPCYPKNTVIIHPVTLQLLTYDDAFCPISLQEYNGKEYKNALDTCFNPIDIKNISNENIQESIINPTIDFNCKYFLSIYNNIFTYDDFIVWLTKNKKESILTQKRIVECVLNIYGKDIIIINDQLINFFVEIIKKLWIDYIYSEINKYIKVIHKKIIIVHPSKNKLSLKDFIVERKNYILDNLLNKNEVEKFLIKYLSLNKSNWDKITDHLKKIEDDLVIYLKNKLEISIH